ncbi:dentin sialophosphoprotein [Patella vulgata]|uniref:dentin sialophosphoprotein n=1 Tax=Patella vulgata TaxID=6465 RepID=UPI00217FD631|nr:dentin sialophosphoprotein [Patella vulgata]XP_050417042.1 dentin sialophosphoprotein [Patella vulgata]XP_050417043.1 dentin sialophosphoprotein [Patella vulgata]
MLRWLKDRKKGKKGDGVKDEYGFKGGKNGGDYGFDDKVYHIYEEIPDLPDLEQSIGPYMVVPLDLGDKKVKSKRVSFQDVKEVSVDSGICHREFNPFDLVNSTNSPSQKQFPRNIRTVPVMGIGQKTSKKSDITCALVHRNNSNAPALPARNSIKKSSLSAKSVENVTESKLKSRQLLENILSDLSKSSDDIFSDHDSSSDAKLSSSSSNSVDDILCEKRRNNTSMDSNDTGCEYDMGSSGDNSSQDSYEYYLHQVEQNFILKCRVNEIANDKTATSVQRRDTNYDEESDSDSLTTISTLSQATVYPGKARRTPECDSDEGTMADLSESENSSGYYESCSLDKKDQKPVIRLTSAILQNSSQRSRSHKHKTSKPRDKKSSTLSASEKTTSKPKTNILEEICEKYETMSESSSNDIYSRNSCSEVYSPPPMRSENQTVRKAPSCSGRVGDVGPRYQSVGNNNNNRLLSDLIMMNYNKQIFHH